VKQGVKRLLGHRLIWKATKPIRKRGCVALTYHRIGAPGNRFPHVPTDVFRAQMHWIGENCDVLDPFTLTKAIDSVDGRRPAVLVTFDDGYRDYYLHACPVLSDLGIRAINFLPTYYIDTGEPFWWDLLDAAVDSSSRRQAPDPLGPRQWPLDTAQARRAYGRRWKSELKKTPLPHRSPMLETALEQLGVSRASLTLGRQVMTWDEVRSAAAVTVFGGHSHNHPIMSLLDDAALDAEVAQCAQRIEAETGRRPRFFAYPSGAYSEAARRAVAKAGYDVAFTTTPGFNSGHVDWMAVRRIHAPPRTADLALALSGWRRGV
jgi:peptidoglycan/xylan/chitin deacetylase (PgdA/CDA1 family)